jgi:hypothetical protein
MIQIFAPDYSATVLGAKICAKLHEHSMYINKLECLYQACHFSLVQCMWERPGAYPKV